ncbi:MAG: glycosyltransferase [Kocuria sp.]|uniref:D-inositol 3-phosphate glycosyltransferase n=1 Tax=Kocuria salsicia TaxID=664639 RepID=A0ABV3KCA6_9MICC|nr:MULTISPECIES: glycosyltransferase [Kocuria]MDO4256262.1 glycosyltransferase [Kocuria sp.]
MPHPDPRHVLLLSMHTSPVDQPGSGDAGGLNVYVWHLARALAQAGWRVDMATLDRDPAHGAGVRSATVADGVRLLTVALPGAARTPKSGLPGFAPRFGRALAAHYDRDGASPDVLHAHYWLSGVAALETAAVQAARGRDVPVVLTLHTSAAAKNLRAGPDEVPEPREREDSERDLVARACHTIVNTPAEREQVVELYGARPERVVVIPPGVDTTVFHPGAAHAAAGPSERGSDRDSAARAHPFTVLCAGRVQPLKGQQVLVRALGLLRREHPESPVRLVLAGVGAPEFLDRLHELAAEEGVTDAVQFLGSLPRPELAGLMGAVDAVAVPSSSETFGLVAVEAQACGTPVMATDVDGLRYAVRDGETGWLVPGRDPADWARAMHRAASEPRLWGAMSPAAQARAQELTWDDVAAAHARTYLACARPAPSA